MLDSIRIKQLENGFTVRYHVQKIGPDGKDEAGNTRERYVPNKGALVEFVTQILNEHTP